MMPFPPIPPQPPALVAQVAAEYNLPPSLVWAVVWRESQGVAGHYTPENGGAPSVGWMQVNLPTVHAMSSPRWKRITVEELMNPRTNLECGCTILRWYLVLALRDECGLVTYRPYQAGPLVERLGPQARRAVLSRAAAYYNGGEHVPEAEGRFENQEYVDDVLGFWEVVEGQCATVEP